MLKGREGMLKGRGGDAEVRGEDVEGNGGTNGKGDGEGMGPPVSLSYAVVASSSRGFIPCRRRCASSRGFVVACWHIVVLHPAIPSTCVVVLCHRCLDVSEGG